MELLDAPLGGRDRAHRLPAVALLPAARRGPRGRRARARRRADAGLRRRERLLRGPENKIPEQDKANEGIVRIAREVGRPLVGTADVHYLRREDYDHHAALLCVQTKSHARRAEAALRHQRVLSEGPRRDGGRRSRAWPEARADHARDRRALRGRAGARQACCSRATRRRTAGPRATTCARWRRGGPAPPLRRPAAGGGARAARVRARGDRARWASTPTS